MPFNQDTKRYDTPCTYTVKEKSNLNNRMYEEGETVSYDGMPAENLVPTDDEGASRYQDYLASNKERVELMKAQYSESVVGDADKFAAAFAKELAKVKADSDEKIAALTGLVEKLVSALTPAEAPVAPSTEHPDSMA
jgi:hypothetical protein